MSKTIAVALPKGGVGKTTTSVNLAASLAVAEQRTLLIDMDTFGASGLSLGFTEGSIKAGLFEVFNFVTGLPNAIHKTELRHLDFVPSNVQSLQMEERMLRLADNRSILRNALRGVSQQYDYIILDCPPFLRGMCTNALNAADSVLIPIKSGHFALDAVDKLFKYIDWMHEVANKNLSIEGILFTMFESHTRVTEITMRELNAKYRKHLLNTVIPKNTALSEASFYGKPAVLYNVNSRGAAAYLALANEIIERNAPKAAEPVQPSIPQPEPVVRAQAL
jgi:chromosome partitioning protein